MKRPDLSAQLSAHVADLAEAVSTGHGVDLPLSRYITTIGALPARSIGTVEEEVRSSWDVHQHTRLGTVVRLLRRTPSMRRQSELIALAHEPRLAPLYIFHRDGWLREAALGAWSHAPASALEFAAIAQRLNDWAPPVRRAALLCAERFFPVTPASVVAGAAPFLFEHAGYRQRWGVDERTVLDAALYRPDVLEALADWLTRPSQGRVGIILRQAMRRPGIDAALPKLARNARPPAVRAIALEALVLGRAQWHIGYRYEWIDKRYGLRRRVPEYAERPVERSPSLTELLSAGASDKAPSVRRMVGRLLLQLADEGTSTHVEIAQRLATDKVASVSAIGDYYLRNCAKY